MVEEVVSEMADVSDGNILCLCCDRQVAINVAVWMDKHLEGALCHRCYAACGGDPIIIQRVLALVVENAKLRMENSELHDRLHETDADIRTPHPESHHHDTWH
jgi:hypothetical protein